MAGPPTTSQVAGAQPQPADATSVENVLAAFAAAPLDPQTIVALAHISSDPSDTVENAQSMATMGKTAKIANALTQTPREVQPEIHARLESATGDDDLQPRLQTVGYQKMDVDPSGLPQPKKGGLFNDVIGGLESARHAVAATVEHPVQSLSEAVQGDKQILGAASNVTGRVAGDVLRPVGAVVPSGLRSAAHQTFGALNTLAAVAPHIYRAAMYQAEGEKGGAGLGPSGILPAIGRGLEFWKGLPGGANALSLRQQIEPFTPTGVKQADLGVKQLAKTWQETENGAMTFDPNVVAGMKSQYSAQTFKLIQDVAGGGDPAQIASQWGPTLGPEVLAAVKLPEFQQAVKQLQNSRISFGRSVVGENMLNEHPEAANLISGGIDGLVDWYDNPLVLGSMVHNSELLARYSLSANDVQTMYRTGGQVTRAMDYAAKAVNRGGIDGLIHEYPELGPLADDLKPIMKYAAEQGRPLAGDDIARWLSTEQGMIALNAGRAGRFFHGEVMAPHLSALGSAYKQGRVALSTAINWAADDLPTMVKKLAPGVEEGAERDAALLRARMLTGSAAARVRRMGRLVPRSNAIVDGSSDAILDFRRYANMFLPAAKARDWTNIFADADSAGRYTAIRGLSSDIFDAMGRADNPDLDNFASAWLGSGDDDFRNGQHYLANGGDRFGSGPSAMPVGLTAQDMSTVWRLPDWKEIELLSKKTAVLGQLRVRVGSMADEALRLWRVGILARVGMAERASGEELAGKLARNGLSPLVRSYAARTADDVFHQVAEQLPPEILAQMKTPDELWGAWYYFTRLRPLRATGVLARKTGIARAVAGDSRMASMKLFVEQGNGRDAFERYASSLRQADAGLGDSMNLMTRMTTMGEGSTGVELRPGRDYTISGPGDFAFHEKWAMRMNALRGDPLIQTALANTDKTLAQQQRAVLAVMQEDSPYMRDLRKLNPRSKGLPDGRMVGTNGVTQRMADRDWANRIVQQANEQVKSPRGETIKMTKTGQKTLAQKLLDGRVVPSDLTGIARRDLPQAVLGPEIVPYATNWFEKLMSGAMENFVGKPMDWLSRQPIFLDNYHMGVLQARRHLARFSDKGATVTEAKKVTRQAMSVTGHPVRVLSDDKAAFDRIPAGHIRVFRGEDPTRPLGDDGPATDSPSLKYRAGRNWTTLHTVAKNYAGAKGHVLMADIPASELARWGSEEDPNLIMQAQAAGKDRYGHLPLVAPEMRLTHTATQTEQITRQLTDAEKTAHFDKLVNDVATERAINETLPYVHDVRSRTQFEVAHRRSAPFLFAQRQFYARWLRNFQHSPQAIARASTIMNGLKVSGFVHNDPQTGEAYFVYPGSGTLNNVVTKTLRALGLPSYMNVPSSFTGEVSALTPGLTGVVPGASPFISIGAIGLSTLFPGSQTWGSIASLATGGSENPSEGLLGNFAGSISPSIVTRVVSALGMTDAGRSELSTQIINAMAYLDATGHGLPEDATLHQTNVYAGRLKTWATSMLLVKAALGFAVPAAPELNTDSLGLDKEMLTLLNKLPYDQAIAAFVEANPDGLPYTVGKTGSVSGTELPTTSAGLQYMNQHLSFLKNYPSAAPWLIPQSTQAGPYDQAAENEQLLLGLRQRRDPVADQGLLSSWYDELVYARDGTAYFNAEQEYYKVSNAPGADYNADKVIWDKWSANYLATHPAFQAVKAAALPTQRRTQVMAEMEEALKDPSLPKNPTTTAISTLLDVFHNYQNALEDYSAGGVTLPGDGTKKWDVTNAFVNWATDYVAKNPAAAPFWSGVLQYETSY